MPVLSTDRPFRATASLIAALVCAFALAAGCGGDERVGGTSNEGEEDAGQSTDGGDDVDADDGGQDEDGGDAGEQEPERPLPTGRSAFQQCAAAGSASGDGYQIVQCTAPVEHQGQVAEGGGYRLEQRSFRWVAP